MLLDAREEKFIDIDHIQIHSHKLNKRRSSQMSRSDSIQVYMNHQLNYRFEYGYCSMMLFSFFLNKNNRT